MTWGGDRRPQGSEKRMKRALIVYHSRTGHTRRVAQALARRLEADIEEIKIVQPMAGWLGYAMCAIESLTALTPALRPMRRNPADYDLVLIGTPVWFWNVASPVRSWLGTHRLRRRVAFFCTMGGSGAGRAISTMTRLVGHEPVATMALIESEVDAKLVDRIEPFARALHFRRPRRPRQTPRRAAVHAVA